MSSPHLPLRESIRVLQMYDTDRRLVSSTAALFIPHIVSAENSQSFFVDDVTGKSPGICDLSAVKWQFIYSKGNTSSILTAKVKFDIYFDS